MLFFLLCLMSLAEFFLFGMLFYFFTRLRRSEAALLHLRDHHADLLEKMRLNAELEQELMQSFVKRRNELHALNGKLEERENELRQLLAEAETISRSPQFLRELILTGSSRGRSAEQLAKASGLSVDEVELILTQRAPR